MGANFDSRTYLREGLEGFSLEEVKKEFEKDCEEAAYSEGHGGYTGSIAEHTQGEDHFILLEKIYSSEDEAVEAMEEVSDKWGPTIIAKYEGLFPESDRGWVIGGYYSC